VRFRAYFNDIWPLLGTLEILKRASRSEWKWEMVHDEERQSSEEIGVEDCQ
jgi:hypothetical protein